MRIAPIVLIVIGLFGLAKYFGLLPVGFFHVLGPVLLIVVGVALLFRRPCGGRRRWDRRTEGSGNAVTKTTSASAA